MSKRGYTHVQELLPAIKAMVEAGKTQREIAEHYGFKDKEVVRELLKRERRKERVFGICHVQIFWGVPERLLYLREAGRQT